MIKLLGIASRSKLLTSLSVYLSPAEFVPYEEVVTGLEADTVAVSATAGVEGERFAPGPIPQAVVISIKVGNTISPSSLKSSLHKHYLLYTQSLNKRLLLCLCTRRNPEM